MWDAAFSHGLEALHKVTNSEGCAEQLLEMLRRSPFEMSHRQQVVDALVCVSEAKLREYLGFLVEKGIEEQIACRGILSIADFSSRTNIERPYKPFQILTETLTELSRDDLGAILKNCEVLVNDFDELFNKPNITKKALDSLFETFKYK